MFQEHFIHKRRNSVIMLGHILTKITSKFPTSFHVCMLFAINLFSVDLCNWKYVTFLIQPRLQSFDVWGFFGSLRCSPDKNWITFPAFFVGFVDFEFWSLTVVWFLWFSEPITILCYAQQPMSLLGQQIMSNCNFCLSRWAKAQLSSYWYVDRFWNKKAFL